MRFVRIVFVSTLVFLSSNTAFPQSPWRIVARTINPNNYYGITLANGMVGMVSSAEPLKVSEVILNGVYDYYQRGRVSNILKTFSHMNMHLEVDNHRISRKVIDNYMQVLDMKEAKLITTFEVGNTISVKHELMALRNLPYSAMSIITVTAKRAVEISSVNYIEAPDHLSDVRNLYAEVNRPHVSIPLMSSVGYSPGMKKVAASTSFIFPEAHGSEPDISHEDWDYNMHLMRFNKRLKAGETYRFALVGTSISSSHNIDPHNEAERLTIYARLEGIERLHNAHKNAWKELWESDIIIEGDLESQRAVRSALYHLYSFARKGTAYSLSPMGLSGLGYNGHIFWDTELWMYPPLLVLHPEIAKSLLEYRYERLEAAKENAFAHGFEGAMFPWESAEDGSEDTPVWALTGPFQQHISATIGWAFWKYYLVTKDRQWLKTRGFPVLKEIADFWISRVEPNGVGGYDINNVIGANEWEENINNNAYTNGVVKTVLEYASLAGEELEIEVNPEWRKVGKNIPILQFSDGTTRENQTYTGAMIKQVDVNLLAYPLKIVNTPAAIKRDLKFYESRLSSNGPAMGTAILSTLYARLGNPEKAFSLFKSSYKPNELPPFGVLAETAGGTNPYFATGAGGTLQAVIFGLGGLDIGDDSIIQLETSLPKSWHSLTLKGIGVENNTYVRK